MTTAHGFSEYTPDKQKHLQGILSSCQEAWRKPHLWAHPERIFVDCTAGCGIIQGQWGSPLIVNRFAWHTFGDAYRHLCCERDKANYQRLLSVAGAMNRADVINGDYVDVVPVWLRDLKVEKPALGLIYCDVNGVKDLVFGIEMFEALVSSGYWQRLDLLFHLSVTAYARSNGAGIDWAQESHLAVMDKLAGIKPYAYIREPMTRQRWVMLHMLKTSKVVPVWKTERIMRYADWRIRQIQPEQVGLFEMSTDV